MEELDLIAHCHSDYSGPLANPPELPQSPQRSSKEAPKATDTLLTRPDKRVSLHRQIPDLCFHTMS